MAEEKSKGNILTNEMASKGGAAVARKLVARAVGASAGAATGGIGYVAAEVGSRAATWINNNKGKVGTVLGGLVAAPFVLGATLVSAIGAGLAALGSAIVIALGAIVLSVIFIFFIINNSALVVPPYSSGTASGTIESRYLSVTKTPNPTGPFSNENLPLEVTYTITISAKEGTLTNISLEYNCFVSITGGTKQCPPNPTLPSPPEQVTIGNPFTFSYTMQYDNTFVDALVTDTITVSANSSTGGPTNASANASIVIGDPPTSCFVFDSNWPLEEKNLQTQAILQMETTAPSFSARLCAGGPITLQYSTENVMWGGWHLGNRTVRIYPRGRGSLPNRYYTLTHEVGHVYGAAYRANLYQYRDDSFVRREAPICTYPLANHPWFEDYAEMIALFLTQGNPTSTYRDFTCLNGQTFRERYPIHWQWTRDNIILDDLGW